MSENTHEGNRERAPSVSENDELHPVDINEHNHTDHDSGHGPDSLSKLIKVVKEVEKDGDEKRRVKKRRFSAPQQQKNKMQALIEFWKKTEESLAKPQHAPTPKQVEWSYKKKQKPGINPSSDTLSIPQPHFPSGKISNSISKPTDPTTTVKTDPPVSHALPVTSTDSQDSQKSLSVTEKVTVPNSSSGASSTEHSTSEQSASASTDQSPSTSEQSSTTSEQSLPISTEQSSSTPTEQSSSIPTEPSPSVSTVIGGEEKAETIRNQEVDFKNETKEKEKEKEVEENQVKILADGPPGLESQDAVKKVEETVTRQENEAQQSTVKEFSVSQGSTKQLEEEVLSVNNSESLDEKKASPEEEKPAQSVTVSVQDAQPQSDVLPESSQPTATEQPMTLTVETSNSISDGGGHSPLGRDSSYSVSIDRSSSLSIDSQLSPDLMSGISTPLASMTSPLSEKDLEKLAKTRERVQKELIDTEQSYVDALGILVNEFIHPLKTSDKLDIPHDKINLMFSNVELLANFHNMFLASLKTTKSVASVVLQYADFLKMYTQYLNSYPIALHTIDEFRSDKRFQAFLATKRAKCGLDLMSYLIMPVQRVPRYQLLLKEIKRCTLQDHEEYAKLEEAYLKIQAIATHINESKRTVEGMSKLLEIQNRITGDFGQLLQPHRRLIREGVVSKLVPGIIQSQHIRKLFLFNDILLWTTNSNKFRGHLQLLGSKTVEVVDKKKYGFKLEPHTVESSDASHGTTPSDTTGGLSAGSDIKDKSGKAKPIIFFCKDEQEQKMWISDLREASSHLAETRDAMKRRKDKARSSKGKKSDSQIQSKKRHYARTAFPNFCILSNPCSVTT